MDARDSIHRSAPSTMLTLHQEKKKRKKEKKKKRKRKKEKKRGGGGGGGGGGDMTGHVVFSPFLVLL